MEEIINNCSTGAYVMKANMFESDSKLVVLGEVHCIGTETKLLECSHGSIGAHACGLAASAGYIPTEHAFDVAISCSGR